MSQFLWNLSAFIIVLGVLITIHEYGHYWVARKCGVKVLRFSIGFGKPIWRKVDKNGTEFVITPIPLGGYVRMLDERVDDVAEDERHLAFNQKPVLNRIAILAAGPLANFALAIFAFWLMFIIGMQSVKPVVGEVTPDSIAARAQLPTQQVITQVSGRDVQTWEDVTYALVENLGKDTLTITTLEQDTLSHQTTELDIANWKFDPDEQGVLASLGIMVYRPHVTPEITTISEDSPASRSDLEVGDVIVRANGEVHPDWRALVAFINAHPDQDVELVVERSGVEQSINVRLGQRELRNGDTVGFLGVTPKADPWPESYLIHLQYNPIEAVGRALHRTWQLVELSFDMIGKLLTGVVSVKNLSGPISIAQGAGTSADYGLVYFLSFMALISVNLGVINLLPLPVLDGGHLLYYVIELLRGKPLSERVQEIGFRIGAMVLLMIMSIAIVNDISRL